MRKFVFRIFKCTKTFSRSYEGVGLFTNIIFERHPVKVECSIIFKIDQAFDKEMLEKYFFIKLCAFKLNLLHLLLSQIIDHSP